LQFREGPRYRKGVSEGCLRNYGSYWLDSAAE